MTVAKMKVQKLLLKLAGGLVLGALLPGLALAAQEGAADGAPRLVNAEKETQAVSGGLAATVQTIATHSDKAEWIGYGVERVAGQQSACCGNYNDGEICGTCRLESENRGFTTSKNDSVKLEGGHRLVVLLRVEDRKVMRIRIASDDCTLDAGNLRFVWLTNVNASESVQFLSGYVLGEPFQGHGRDGLGGEALTAIALHADGGADRAFAIFVAAQRPEELRKKASFWLGETRGATGLAMLKTMAKNDGSTEVRSQVA